MKFKKKIDILFWFIIAILPILIYFFVNFHATSAESFSVFISSWRFDFIADIFNDIFVDTFIFPVVLVDVLSYFISVEIIHVFVDCVAFLPRFAHQFLEGYYAQNK